MMLSLSPSLIYKMCRARGKNVKITPYNKLLIIKYGALCILIKKNRDEMKKKYSFIFGAVIAFLVAFMEM